MAASVDPDRVLVSRAATRWKASAGLHKVIPTVKQSGPEVTSHFFLPFVGLSFSVRFVQAGRLISTSSQQRQRHNSSRGQGGAHSTCFANTICLIPCPLYGASSPVLVVCDGAGLSHLGGCIAQQPWPIAVFKQGRPQIASTGLVVGQSPTRSPTARPSPGAQFGLQCSPQQRQQRQRRRQQRQFQKLEEIRGS